jgi:uncharacterized coiled-coil protein SlyX
MKRVLMVSIALVALAPAFTASAGAKCNVSCLNRKVRALASGLAKAEKTIAAQSQTIAQLNQKVTEQGQTTATQGSAIGVQAQGLRQVNAKLACLVEVPLTQYGQPEGPLGYLFQFENEAEELETLPTTALDATYPEDFVSGWALFDGCNSAETATTASSSAVAPAADLRSYPRPATLLP